MKKPVKAAPVPKAPVKAHRKPVPVTKAVKTARHAAAVKAAKTRAANAKKAKHHPVRKLALGEGVACCSAEALAASLRLAGQPVSGGDVLALYWRTASDADAGASILATLETASAFGLAAYPLVSFRCAESPYNIRTFSTPLILGISYPAPHAVLATPDGWWSWGELYEPWTDDIDEAWEVTWPATR